MNNIEWNRVTWYSKIIAMALFVALPFIGFYYGIQYGSIVASLKNGPATSTVNTAAGGEEYYTNIAEWQTDRGGPNSLFSIAYPIDFDTQEPRFTLVIPRAFEPQTNFIEAKLTAQSTHDAAAVAGCLTPDQTGGPATPTSTATISGVPFTVFRSAGAGAGNYYETTSYRAVRDGRCYAIEYTLHSSQIMNYPEEYHLHAFDRARLTDLLDRIVHTFMFRE